MCSVRVANELGRGDANAVRFAIKILLGTSVVIGVVVWILCLVFGSQLGYMFTQEAAVAEAVSDLAVLLAFSVLFNSIYPVFSGSFCVSNFVDFVYRLFLPSEHQHQLLCMYVHQASQLEQACSRR